MKLVRFTGNALWNSGGLFQKIRSRWAGGMYVESFEEAPPVLWPGPGWQVSVALLQQRCSAYLCILLVSWQGHYLEILGL